MKGTVKVVTRDRGMKFLRNKLGRLDERGVDIGHWGVDKYPPRPDDGPNAGVLDTVQVAMLNEFGHGGTPARPFHRVTMSRNFENLNQHIRDLYNRLLGNPGFSEDAMLRTLGRNYRITMQMTIANASSWAAPLAKATIEKKGHSKPLLERYLMINRIKTRIGRRIDR